MSKNEGKSVSYAVVDQQLHHPETGAFGPVLTNKADSTHKPVKMTICEPWVLVEKPTAKDPKKIVRFLIHGTRFQHIVLADEKNS